MTFFCLLALIVGQMAVPCCFCMKEFPSWSDVVTSHIASHVKIKSIRCVACCLSFVSKESLTSHLHRCHSKLPKGICIDVSIANHERRQLQCKTDLKAGTETLPCGPVLPTESQQDSSATMQHVEDVIRNENSADRNEAGMTGAERVNIDSVRRGITSNIDAEVSGESTLEQNDNSSTFHYDNNVQSSGDFSPSKTCKRKLRRPSHVVTADASCAEITRITDSDWVEIVAATRPMISRCPHCSFTCNTDLQLKVRFVHICKWCNFYVACCAFPMQ